MAFFTAVEVVPLGHGRSLAKKAAAFRELILLMQPTGLCS